MTSTHKTLALFLQEWFLNIQINNIESSLLLSLIALYNESSKCHLVLLMIKSIKNPYLEELTTQENSSERIQISYSRQESGVILPMEEYLMKVYTCNRSQLHKNLVKKEYALHHHLYNLS